MLAMSASDITIRLLAWNCCRMSCRMLYSLTSLAKWDLMALALSPTTILSKMTLHSSRSAVTAVCVSMTLASIASLV
jgi:hypothetical protein